MAQKLSYLTLHPTTEDLCISDLDAGVKKEKLTQLLVNKKLANVVSQHGRKLKLFIASDNSSLCEAKTLGSRNGYVVDTTDLNGYAIASIHLELTDEQKAENRHRKNANLIRKIKNAASKANFTNKFIRDCLNADENLSMVQNKIGGGSEREGAFFTTQVVAKHINGQAREEFIEALSKKRPFKYKGIIAKYDGTIELGINQDGEFFGSINLEYQNSGHGHYYLLINEKNFCYYEKD